MAYLWVCTVQVDDHSVLQKFCIKYEFINFTTWTQRRFSYLIAAWFAIRYVVIISIMAIIVEKVNARYNAIISAKLHIRSNTMLDDWWVHIDSNFYYPCEWK